MIKRLLDKVFKRGGARATVAKPDAPRVYVQAEHRIERAWISSAALRTCEGLQQAGYKSYVVGGAVRDLLLGRHPKDFDVATDATPEQVRAVFRRSRIIGRRFRIVHVMFGAETVEVSTFRAAHSGDLGSADDIESMPDPDSPASADAANERGRDRQRVRPVDSPNTPKGIADEHGRLLRDNVFGTQQEDAVRRDFTMNALFYDPARQEVWDYVHGVSDIAKRRVVMIGEPAARYREDPVRMLRAARLSAKLGFEIDPATRAPIAELTPLLANVPEARLFDELMKMLLSGHSLESLNQLRALGLHRQVIPTLDSLLNSPTGGPLVRLALARTDERVLADKGVNPAFLFAALLWTPMCERQQALVADGRRPLEAQHLAMDEVIETHRRAMSFPRRYEGVMKELWMAQPRFEQRSKAKAYRTLTHPRFRACYDFYALRAAAGNADSTVADWWTEFQISSEERREAMLLPDDAPKKKRRRRKKPAAAGAGAAAESAAPEGSA